MKTSKLNGTIAGMTNLKEVLCEKRASICQKWLVEILKAIPQDIKAITEAQNDMFSNPIGYIISKELPSLYERIVLDNNAKATVESLENIIRIMAVQELTAAQTINIIFLLKQTVQNELVELNINPYSTEDLMSLNEAVDNCVLLAANIYYTCRETIHELKVKEIKAERDRAILMFERVRPTIPTESE